MLARLLCCVAFAAAAMAWTPPAIHPAYRVASAFTSLANLGKHQLISTGIVSHTNSSTHSNSTAHSNTTNCDSKTTVIVAALHTDAACDRLFALFEAKQVDVDAACSNPCWNRVIAAVMSLRSTGCWSRQETDVGTIQGICTEANCRSADAGACVDAWVSQSCPNEPTSLTCEPFGVCQYQNLSRCDAPACLNNCSGHGTCVTGPNIVAHCQCHKGYGRSQFGAEQDCAEYTQSMCEESCHGHGLCVPHESGVMGCECQDGFVGQACDQWKRCEVLAFCSGHGECTRPYNSDHASCVCAPGFFGETCSEQASSCPDNCNGHGVCESTSNQQRVCRCAEHYSGESCNHYSGPTCQGDCSGAGECTANNVCECAEGFNGTSCSEIVGTCSCRHGFCHSNACDCLPGFQGPLCSVYNHTRDTGCAALNFCSGYGVCSRQFQAADHTYKYGCTCFEGFSGSTCSQVDANYPDQCPNYCSGHGHCVLMESPHCKCDAGWTGKDCATSACPSFGGRACDAHGICEKLHNSTQFQCTCTAGYVHGDQHSCEVSLCPNDCNGRGICQASGACVCRTGFTGSDCSVATARAVTMVATTTTTSSSKSTDEDEETGNVLDASLCANSCNNHGECVTGKCVCGNGYTGDDCAQELPSLYEEKDDLDNLDLLEINTQVGKAMAKLW